jgi:hypothetical protein
MNRNFSGIHELIMFGCMGIYVPDGNNPMNPSYTSGKKPGKKSDTSIEPGIWSASEDLHTPDTTANGVQSWTEGRQVSCIHGVDNFTNTRSLGTSVKMK